MQAKLRVFALASLTACFAAPLSAQTPFFFSTNSPDGLMAMASRPGPSSGVTQEHETGDDFLLSSPLTALASATFTGLVPANASVSQVVVEIYRVFPKDSDTVRTINVPTRVNSPSDVAFASRDSTGGDLTFTTTLLNSTFTAANSVDNGIHPSPNQTTGGDGPVTGQEVEFSVDFSTPFILPADHYFFVPQVLLTNGDFLWLSAAKPIVAPGTPFNPDLQAWIRDAQLDPDWLRVGTDIVGAGTFNASFSLTGQAVPEPGDFALLAALGMTGAGFLARRRLTSKSL